MGYAKKHLEDFKTELNNDKYESAVTAGRNVLFSINSKGIPYEKAEEHLDEVEKRVNDCENGFSEEDVAVIESHAELFLKYVEKEI